MLRRRRKSLSLCTDSICSDEDDILSLQPPAIPFHGDAVTRESEDDARLIQVAVRCRPRKRRRQESNGSRNPGWRHDGAASASSDDDSGDCSSSSDAPSAGSVIKYSASRQGRSSSTRPCLYVQAHKQARPDGVKRRFEFDFVLPPWKTQIEVYNDCVASEIAHVLATHQRQDQRPAHATIVAYGQTGTGKTFTMGMLSDFHDDQNRGIIPRALEQILAYAARSNAAADRYDVRGSGGGDGSHQRPASCIVSMSFLQIYLETVQDLLVFPSDTAFDTTTLPRRRNLQHHHHPNADLQVRQRQNQTFYVAGLSEYEVRSISDARILLETASRNRTLASTARNRTSSRSHTLLTISLKKGRRSPDSCRNSRADSENESSDYENSEELRAEEEETTSTVSFVDLAGSERIESTLHFMRSTRKRQELRIREAKFINKSLSALGSVIAALAEPKRRRADPARLGALSGRSRYTGNQKQQQQNQGKHIRFRDSQLTKLLQGRLMQGKGRLLLIATIDDRVANLNETLSTLKFAAQCRRVELQSPRSKAAKRKESLLQQVFQEMKTTYEERERALHQKYQARVTELEDQLQECKTTDSDGMGGTQQSATMQRASYLALCSLADQAEAATYCDQLQSSTTTKHPPVESFKNDKDMIKYVAELYRQLQTALPKATPQEKKKTCVTSPVQQERAISPDSPVVTAILRESCHDLPTKAALKKFSPVKTGFPPLNLRDAVQVPALAFNVKAVEVTSSKEDTEYQAITEYLRSTGALDGLVVCSLDDQDAEPFSQI